MGREREVGRGESLNSDGRPVQRPGRLFVDVKLIFSPFYANHVGWNLICLVIILLRYEYDIMSPIVVVSRRSLWFPVLHVEKMMRRTEGLSVCCLAPEPTLITRGGRNNAQWR